MMLVMRTQEVGIEKGNCSFQVEALRHFRFGKVL